jgi:hypothetical protein
LTVAAPRAVGADTRGKDGQRRLPAGEGWGGF